MHYIPREHSADIPWTVSIFALNDGYTKQFLTEFDVTLHVAYWDIEDGDINFELRAVSTNAGKITKQSDLFVWSLIKDGVQYDAEKIIEEIRQIEPGISAPSREVA